MKYSLTPHLGEEQQSSRDHHKGNDDKLVPLRVTLEAARLDVALCSRADVGVELGYLSTLADGQLLIEAELPRT